MDVVNKGSSLCELSGKPSPQCQLFFGNCLQPLADNLFKLSVTLENLSKQDEKLAKTVHGANYDNGLLQVVKEHERAIQEIRGLPDALRSQVLHWGFYLLGAQSLMTGVFVGILMWVIRLWLTSAVTK